MRLRQALVLENELARARSQEHRRRAAAAIELRAAPAQGGTAGARERAAVGGAVAALERARADAGAGRGAGASAWPAPWRLYLRARQSNRELAVTNEKLAHASLHDKVTGLLNRRAMEADTRAIELAGTASYCNVSISVKQFGLIVGSVGHQLGDALLCQIATRLDQVVRAASTAACTASTASPSARCSTSATTRSACTASWRRSPPPWTRRSRSATRT